LNASFMDPLVVPAALTSAERLSQQRQRLHRLAEDYAKQAQKSLALHEVMKGSVYQLRTRCGCPSCHCAQPGSARHAAMVLSWGNRKHRHLRALLPADVERIKRLTGNYHQLLRVRRTLGRLHREVIAALDQLERLLLGPPHK
jgi:hypothetical protein